jgi:hypothetical protein
VKKRRALPIYLLGVSLLAMLFVSAPFVSRAQTASVFLLNNNAFDNATPTVYQASPEIGAPWEVIIQPNLQYATANNQSALDLLFVSHATSVSGATGNSYTCTSVTGQTCSYSYLRVYLEAGGGLTIYYLQNSTVSTSGANIYVTSNNVLGTGCVGVTCFQNYLYLDYSGSNDSGYGLLNFYTVTPNGQTTTELGNTTISGFFFVNYVAGVDPNVNGKPTSSAGFVQVTVQELPASVEVGQTFNVIFAVIPVVVVVAVVGWLGKYLSNMKF